MEHQQIWAPWRLAYIANAEERKKPGCFLCHYRDDPESDVQNYVLFRSRSVFAVLNRFPYNNGHLLVSPLAHKAALVELTEEELIDGMRLVRSLTSILTKCIHPEGFNVGLNLGTAAGAGVPGHMHWHIVPRWNGDTNFMPILGDANVIPQSLEALHELLTETIGESDLTAAISPTN